MYKAIYQEYSEIIGKEKRKYIIICENTEQRAIIAYMSRVILYSELVYKQDCIILDFDNKKYKKNGTKLLPSFRLNKKGKMQFVHI